MGFQPLFGKEGKGRFFAEADRNYVANFWVTTLVSRTLVGQPGSTCVVDIELADFIG